MIKPSTRLNIYFGDKDMTTLEKMNKLQLIHNLTRTQIIVKMMSDQMNNKESVFYQSLQSMN
jgi:hypothetical protein